MRAVGEFLRCLGLIFFCVGLVLLVPSSAWAGSTEEPSSSASPSPSGGSSTPPPATATPEDLGPASTAPTAEPSPVDPAPTSTETVTVTEQPEPQMMEAAGTEADPQIVRLDNETTALLLLGISLTVCCLAAITVSAWTV